jgi:hypothetical protein
MQELIRYDDDDEEDTMLATYAKKAAGEGRKASAGLKTRPDEAANKTCWSFEAEEGRL